MTDHRYVHLSDWANVDRMVARLRSEAEAHAGVVVTAEHGAWSFCFSKSSYDRLGYIFSARLRKNGSTARDWAVLGRVAKLIGAPDKMPETIETDPTASHYWTWGGSVDAKESAAMVDEARRHIAQKLGN